MEKLLDNEIDSKTASWIGVATFGTLLMYVSTGLNQIPNVPENGNLRKSYSRTFESVTNVQLQADYAKTLHAIECDVFEHATDSQDELVGELVKVLSAVNKNTTHLKLNYKQMLKNRFRDFEFTHEQIKAIQTGKIKNLTAEKLHQLWCLTAMYETYQFLDAQSLVRLGIYKQVKPVEKIDQSNRYLQTLAHGKHQTVEDVETLMSMMETSITKFIELDDKENKVKKSHFTQPSVTFVDGVTGKSDKDWEVCSLAKMLPRQMFGDTDLRQCLVMELMTQKALNAFLGKLKAYNCDVDALIEQAQTVIMAQMEQESQKVEPRKILPLQQTAGKASANDQAVQRKKSQLVPQLIKLKKDNEQVQEITR